VVSRYVFSVSVPPFNTRQLWVVAPLLQFRNWGIQLAHHWTTQTNGAAFGTDYFTRTAVAKSNILVNKPIERTSPKFRRLMDLNTNRMCKEGFAYLNNDECIQAWADIYREELETIEYIGSSRLRDFYAQVRDLNERRDLEMFGTIRAHCTSAAQTCGAAGRPSASGPFAVLRVRGKQWFAPRAASLPGIARRKQPAAAMKHVHVKVGAARVPPQS
jgi:hypothetical protein